VSRRSRQLRRRRSQAGAGKAIFSLLAIGAAVAFVGILGGVGYLATVAADTPGIDQLKPLEQGATSTVYTADGTRLGFIQGDVLRTPVPAADMPQTMRDATVAVEDRRFYQHQGVDAGGVMRAAVENASSGETVQGGSTLTMQLVRNLYRGNRERTLKRKVREAKLATELESRHPGPEGKRWILTQYLNNVPYGTVGGQTAVGIEAASRVFFGKAASRLTLAESALLAGLPQAPSQYNPFTDPKIARARRDEVLNRMAAQGYISPEKAAAAKDQPLGVKANSYYAKRREGFFFDYVREELIRKYGADRVRAGGLKVYTTVNLKLQEEARRAINNNLGTGGPSGAVVSMDPKTGEIKAMASSGDYTSTKFNLAAQGQRQPGSTFKVMVMMAALRQGVDINKTTYESKPLNFIDEGTGAKIDVKTYDGSYGGDMTVFEALVKSDNTVYQQLGLDVGPEEVRQAAYDLGITSKLDAYPAESLGGLRIGVSPLEMTRAYATINNGGWRVKPVAITKVELPDGTIDRSLGRTGKVKEFTDGETYEAVKAMEANVQGGTGTGAALGCPTAGKTGTTDNSTDAWFGGFTSSLNTTVWVGYPNANLSMGGMSGGQAPASIFRDFMVVAMNGRPCKEFPEPKEPFVGVDFSGFYFTQGAPGESVDNEEEKKEKKDKKKSGGNNGGRFPDNQYEGNPQPAPRPPRPAPRPEPAPEPAPPTDPDSGGVTPE
jgi:penicillin-binding protein 1A